MSPKTYHLQLLTPCFCAGANQSIAEIRAPSIRGKLRWWFRVVGGDATQEGEVFGSVREEASGSSSVVVRVTEAAVAPKWQPVKFSPNSNTGYILYFAKASAQGARWEATGAIPEGTKFSLVLDWRRKVSEDSRATFDLALQCFLMLGSLGLRSTRGLGSFECEELRFGTTAFEELLSMIRKRSPNFHAGLGQFAGSEGQWLDGLGAQLRGLRKGYSSSKPTPLGSSQPRQASAVYLRPVRDNGKARIVVFEAPAEKILGRESRIGSPRLGNGVPPPGVAPQRYR